MCSTASTKARVWARPREGRVCIGLRWHVEGGVVVHGIRTLVTPSPGGDEFRRRDRSVSADPPEEEDPMTEPVTHTLEVPGAVVRYDVREK